MVTIKAGSDDAVGHTGSRQLVARLLHQLAPMGDDGDALALGGAPRDDGREHHGLPSAGRQDKEWRTVTGGITLAKLRYGGFLVLAQS
jgi:hypothetical protein